MSSDSRKTGHGVTHMADTRPIITTKSRLAKRLGISAARITAYVAEELPVRRDGLVDQAVALDWIRP
jgi:hypothetical protein